VSESFDAALSSRAHGVNRVLVTGATGIVGSHLCEALLDRGLISWPPFATTIPSRCSIAPASFAAVRSYAESCNVSRTARAPSTRTTWKSFSI